MALFDHQIEQGLAAERTGQREGLRLVPPHQRRVQHESSVQAEAERDLHRLDRVVAAVGIAGIVGLADAEHDVLGATAISQRRREGQEDQVASGHEGGR